MCRRAITCSIVVVVLAVISWARDDHAASAACTFDDGKQVSVRYKASPVDNHKPPEGKVWTPGQSPMFFFTSAMLKVGDSQVPVGAYSMYVIPGKDRWTLVLNKNVSENAQYDEKQDLVRAAMGVAKLGQPNKHTSVYFGHVGPKQCNMRLYYGKSGTWIEFHEQ